MPAHRALVITGPGSMSLQSVADAAPGPAEAAVRPAYVGICGTDLELLAGDVDPDYVRYPLVPGHEWSGIVEATGPGVTGLEPGQRVIVEGIVPCRVCARCIRGETNLCEHYDELGFTRAGAAADQVIVPAQLVHVLAPSVSMPEAALAEPAAVAWRALGRGRPRPGERVAVVGDGTVGLIAAHLAGLSSPAEVVVHGLRADQAGLAAALGATGFEVSSADQGAAHGTARAGRYDLVIEAAGTPAAVESAIRLARRGGRIVLLGLAGNGATARLPIDDVVNNDLQISASFGYTSGAWSEVANLLSSGSVRLGPLITHRFPLDAYAAAYQALRDGGGPRGKVLLEVTP
ncbi:MAG TPA: alcohol dehydrogenase catalytic domain-containing protein [Streptosporangiaceae bacterium]|nr:alcohol dehydrogenase catalytic domain-containing protein [Streptosporangiaceae bacterium]